MIWATLAAMVMASVAISRAVRSNAEALLADEATVGVTLSARLPEGWQVTFDADHNGGPGASEDLGMQLRAMHMPTDSSDDAWREVEIRRVAVSDEFSASDLIQRAYEGRAFPGVMEARGVMWEDARPIRLGSFPGALAQVAYAVQGPHGAMGILGMVSVVVAPLGDGTAVFVELKRSRGTERAKQDIPLVRAIAESVKLRE